MMPTVTLLCHAEKELGDHPRFSVASDGNRDPESLTVRGWERAGALVGLFVAQSGADEATRQPNAPALGPQPATPSL